MSNCFTVSTWPWARLLCFLCHVLTFVEEQKEALALLVGDTGTSAEAHTGNPQGEWPEALLRAKWSMVEVWPCSFPHGSSCRDGMGLFRPREREPQ